MDAACQSAVNSTARRSLNAGGAEHRRYGEFLRPRVAQLLSAFALDVVFHRAAGDFLYCHDKQGREVAILDLVGGFGASLFGHNHPALVGIALQALTDGLPLHAQASVRARAALLGETLSNRIARSTGRQYVATLASTGTEAVEAAIKHAELERFHRRQLLIEKARGDARKVRVRLRENSAFPADDFFATSAQVLGAPAPSSLDEAVEALETHTKKALETEPLFFAVVGSFHGKSCGSLQLTYREEFRKPWHAMGPKVVFIPREDEQALYRELHRARIHFPVLSLEPDGRVSLHVDTLVDVTGCFCEPVQGEGGVQELSPDFLRTLRRCADEGEFPFIMDEIQSGMGRCGTFLASTDSGVRADYYLLSKSLGGGLAKISALLVDTERYQTDFGYLHTSTFAEDDYSSEIALGALALLDRDQGALIAECRNKGAAFLERLRFLSQRFPGQVRDVRGRGLMIGLEFIPQLESPSPLLRVLSEQNALTYLVSGYLLHEHSIRVAPTLSDHAVIRIEPSAFISTGSFDAFCDALEDLLTSIRAADTGRLLRFAISNDADGKAPAQESYRHDSLPVCGVGAGTPLIQPAKPAHAKVGFLIHFSRAADLQRWETALAAFSEDDCARFLDRTAGLLHPFVLHETQVHSAAGKTVDLVVIGVPFTAAQALESMRSGADWCLTLTKEGLQLARELGCHVLGLGGHTSIVSLSAQSLLEDELTLTTGNSLTVAAAYDAILQAAAEIGLQPASCRVGIVGAAGNVGAALAELAAEQFGDILMITRKRGERLLRPVLQRIYKAAYARLAADGPSSGIGRALAETDARANALAIDRAPSEQCLNGNYSSFEWDVGDCSPVRLSESMEDLRTCDIIVSATNAARPVVTPMHIAHRPIVVCDVAVPSDVDAAVDRERPLAKIIRGGILKLPLGQMLGIPAVPLRGSEVYGCLAETILLGFAGCKTHFSYGPLSLDRVRQIRTWATVHGFEIAVASRNNVSNAYCLET